MSDFPEGVWVPCSKHLPRVCVPVIAYDENEKRVGEAMWLDGHWMFAEQDSTVLVSHWMPMPKPPENQ